MLPESKRCPRCDQIKPAAMFGTRGGGRWLRSSCRPCNNAEHRRYHHNNRALMAAKYRRWFQKARYGLSTADYDALLAKQGGGCAICGAMKPGRDDRQHLYIDHDHETGRVRGLLCSTCNTGLGMFAEDVDRMRVAIAYLSEATA